MKDALLFEDLPPTVFAPGGRLYSVEKVMRAVHDPSNSGSNVVVAVCYKGGVVIVTTLPQSPYLFVDASSESLNQTNVTQSAENETSTLLHDPSENETSTLLHDPSNHLYHPCPWVQLDRRIWGVTAGPVVDGQILRQRMMLAAQQTREARGNVQASSLARSLADACQIQSQKATEGNLLACSGLVVQENELWRVDPNGQFWKCHATVLGRGATVRSETMLLHLLAGKSTFVNTTDNEPNRTWTRVEIQEVFDQITEDDALAAATETLLHGLFPKMPNTAHSDKEKNKAKDTTLVGLVIGRSKARFFSHKELLANMEHSYDRYLELTNKVEGVS